MKPKIDPNDLITGREVKVEWSRNSEFMSFLDDFKTKYNVDEIKEGHIDMAWRAYISSDNDNNPIGRKALAERILKKNYGTPEYHQELANEKVKEMTAMEKLAAEKERNSMVDSINETFKKILSQKIPDDKIDAQILAVTIKNEIKKMDQVNMISNHDMVIESLVENFKKIRNHYNTILDDLQIRGINIQDSTDANIEKENAEDNFVNVSQAVEEYIGTFDNDNFDDPKSFEEISEKISTISEQEQQKLTKELVTKAKALKDILDKMNNIKINETEEVDEQKQKLNQHLIKERDKSILNTKRQLHLISKIYRILKEKQ